MSQSFVIEWDTQLAAPVAGVPAIGRVLPEHWPADLLAGTAGRKGAGPWTTCSLTGLDSHSIRPMPDAFLPGLKPDIPRYAMPRLNYHIAGSGCPAGGWIALSDVPGHPGTMLECTALHRSNSVSSCSRHTLTNACGGFGPPPKHRQAGYSEANPAPCQFIFVFRFVSDSPREAKVLMHGIVQPDISRHGGLAGSGSSVRLTLQDVIG